MLHACWIIAFMLKEADTISRPILLSSSFIIYSLSLFVSFFRLFSSIITITTTFHMYSFFSLSNRCFFSFIHSLRLNSNNKNNKKKILTLSVPLISHTEKRLILQSPVLFLYSQLFYLSTWGTQCLALHQKK